MANKKILSIILSAVPVGLGHMRAAYPLDEATEGKVLLASSLGSREERVLWKHLKLPYDLLSWFTHKPIISGLALKILDKTQNILPLHTKKDLSKPTFQVKMLFTFIKLGLGKAVVRKARKNPGFPFVTTFYATALAADYDGLEKTFCVVTDTQVNRAWVSLLPKMSRIIYCVPLEQTKERLLAYGVMEKHIFVTGFPLPKVDVDNAKTDFENRLERLGKGKNLNILFSVGGAGAQLDLGMKTIKFFKDKEVNLTISCGVRQKVYDYFKKENIKLFYEKDFNKYFSGFNELLRTTDILITKPSELSFYAALGIPLILTPAIGPHEAYNKHWLESLGASVDFNQVLADFDRLNKNSSFIKLAKNGFSKASREGTKNIYKLINSV